VGQWGEGGTIVGGVGGRISVMSGDVVLFASIGGSRAVVWMDGGIYWLGRAGRKAGNLAGNMAWGMGMGMEALTLLPLMKRRMTQDEVIGGREWSVWSAYTCVSLLGCKYPFLPLHSHRYRTTSYICIALRRFM